MILASVLEEMLMLIDRRSWVDPDEDRKAANRQTVSLAAMAFTLFLVVAGLYLVQHLAAKMAMEDCLMSGRTNCAPVTLPNTPAR